MNSRYEDKQNIDFLGREICDGDWVVKPGRGNKDLSYSFKLYKILSVEKRKATCFKTCFIYCTRREGEPESELFQRPVLLRKKVNLKKLGKTVIVVSPLGERMQKWIDYLDALSQRKTEINSKFVNAFYDFNMYGVIPDSFEF